LSFDVAQDGELVEPRTLRLNHPKGTAIAVPLFVTFVFFVVKSSPPTPTPGSHIGLPLQSFLCVLCG
jgi:hypothetical protein